jgi:hypothetical protein
MNFSHILILMAAITIAASTTAEVKRTANGKPDFSGVYDTGTLTPLSRPAEFGDKQFMTREEADSLIEAAQVRFDFGQRKKSDPNRGAPKKGGDGNNSSGAGGVGGYNAFWIDPGSQAFEIDGKFRTSIIYDPADGRQPKQTPASLKRMAKISASFAYNNDGTASWLAHPAPGPFDGPETLAPSERCLISFGATSPTIPSLYNNYKRIVQTDNHVMILQEMVHDARIIRMNSEHGSAGNRKWLGDSVGHWEGDTLIVETKNFNPVSGLGGADENLHVTERFSSAAEGHIIYNFTVDDPTAWTAPWSGEYVWTAKPSDKVYEYACHEGNYAMEGVLKGARLLESEWEGPSPASR